ncbi:MAG: hypothetical protein KDK91_01425 [Gammaproteobacteria bacterium]|nr:hypothetical protein [Gammaproteobacteria bacterium]
MASIKLSRIKSSSGRGRLLASVATLCLIIAGALLSSLPASAAVIYRWQPEPAAISSEGTLEFASPLSDPANFLDLLPIAGVFRLGSGSIDYDLFLVGATLLDLQPFSAVDGIITAGRRQLGTGSSGLALAWAASADSVECEISSVTPPICEGLSMISLAGQWRLVPEPSPMLLVSCGLALAVLVGVRRRTRLRVPRACRSGFSRRL